ncbi:putative ribonuclease H-like domain-containing protein [Tanacetum coccineum]
MTHSNAVMGSWGSAEHTTMNMVDRGGSVTFRTHKVLFTETECLVVSSDFKMPDENQILLKVPRHHNMYSFDMKTPSPAKGFACLIAKATSDESKFVARRASCKAKLERLITEPLHTLHMDLFGPTSVKSINHASYCLVITDDCTRFSWVFFLASKDETSGILQTFIRQIENQLSHRVKIIRSDNGTEFKNRDMLEFCGNKGIKQEYSTARTPQQNGVAERMNKTLIEAARTMLAGILSYQPLFGQEAINPKCQREVRVLQKVTNRAGNLNLLLLEEKMRDIVELIVVPSAVRFLKKKMNQGNLPQIQRKRILILTFRRHNSKNQGVRRELEENCPKHLGDSPKNNTTSTPSVNTGSHTINTGRLEHDDSLMPELEIFHKPETGIFDEASYDEVGTRVINDFNSIPTEIEVIPTSYS